MKRPEAPLTEGEASDWIASRVLQCCQLTPGSFRRWLIYHRGFGEGVSYIERLFDPGPVFASWFPDPGIVQVPKTF
jgi:hypothetical protein